LLFFSSVALIFALLSLSLGVPVIFEFMETGLVERFPTAILASSIGIIAMLCLFTGLILDNVSRGRREKTILSYLSISYSKDP
jgi:hypothetical protein